MPTRIHSKKTKKKISDTLKRKGIKPPSRKGVHWDEQEKNRRKEFAIKNNSAKFLPRYSGDKHWNWKGGITPINHKIRQSKEYKLWRESVFERDDYTCVWCGAKGGKLNADHILPFAYYPELRFAIDNGRTLCVDCHKTTSNYLRNRKQLAVWGLQGKARPETALERKLREQRKPPAQNYI